MLTQTARTSEQGLFSKPKEDKIQTEDKNSLSARINRLIDTIKTTRKFVVGANELQTLTCCQDFVYDIWCSNSSKYITNSPDGNTFFAIDLQLYCAFPVIGWLFIAAATNRMAHSANRYTSFLHCELKDEQNILVRKAILNLLDLFQIEPYSPGNVPSVGYVHWALGKLVSLFPPKLADIPSGGPKMDYRA